MRHVIVHPGPERLTLEDGSVVELQAGAKVTADFTAAERHIRLEHGTAYFTVTKNPQRPFIVSTGQLTVRAVGTAFSVGLDAQETSVLVTEGRVRVNAIPPAAGEKSTPPRELGSLGAAQQGIIASGAAPGQAGGLEMTVTDLTSLEVERAMSWQGLRLEFVDMPLSEVAAAFNHYSQKKLVIHDAATAGILLDGNFRADNVDAFVRLLDRTFGVSAFPNGGEIILRKTHDP
jgi:transmembrane sensor